MSMSHFLNRPKTVRISGFGAVPSRRYASNPSAKSSCIMRWSFVVICDHLITASATVEMSSVTPRSITPSLCPQRKNPPRFLRKAFSPSVISCPDLTFSAMFLASIVSASSQTCADSCRNVDLSRVCMSVMTPDIEFVSDVF